MTMKKLLYISCLLGLFLVSSCAFKSAGSSGVCSVDSYGFVKTGSEEITLSFHDNGLCKYKLAENTDIAWMIYVSGAYFANLEPFSDKFSDDNIKAVRKNEAGVAVFFNYPFRASEKTEKYKVSGKAGLKRFVFKKIPAAVHKEAGKTVLSLWCSRNPLILRINNDGPIAFDYGLIGGEKSYLDIKDVLPADNFTVTEACGGLLAGVSPVDFPKRTRFLFNDILLPYMKIYSDGMSVFAEDIPENNGHTEREGRILNISEVGGKEVQTVKVYLSGEAHPFVKETGTDFVKINLGGNFMPVAKFASGVSLIGDVFSAILISSSGDEVSLIARSQAADAEVYVEKTDYGFIIYIKKSR